MQKNIQEKTRSRGSLEIESSSANQNKPRHFDNRSPRRERNHPSLVSRNDRGRNIRKRLNFNRKHKFRPEKLVSYERYINHDVVKIEETDNEVKTLFSDLELHPNLQRAIKRRNFKHSTPVQNLSIPAIQTGKNIIGLAKTGTGKTAAFLIPLIDRILTTGDKGLQFIIIAPTRELALQIEKEIISFSKEGLYLGSICCVGGSDIRKQIRLLKQNEFNFVVGTPGRIIDLIENKHIKTEKLSAIVLDEVDRMLDMGFIEDIEFILNQLPETKQTLFFSATLPPSVNKIATRYITDPIRVEIEEKESGNRIKQDIVKYITEDDKYKKLFELIQNEKIERGIVFTQMKVTADEVSNFLYKKGVSANSIHSDKSLKQRISILNRFKNSKTQILVATDVAARGIDVKDITHVINFDEPENHETYIHRIGRTARAGKSGSAYTFVSSN
jgi:superfamily II DNA/RNA helicase